MALWSMSWPAASHCHHPYMISLPPKRPPTARPRGVAQHVLKLHLHTALVAVAYSPEGGSKSQYIKVVELDAPGSGEWQRQHGGGV